MRLPACRVLPACCRPPACMAAACCLPACLLPTSAPHTQPLLHISAFTIVQLAAALGLPPAVPAPACNCYCNFCCFPCYSAAGVRWQDSCAASASGGFTTQRCAPAPACCPISRYGATAAGTRLLHRFASPGWPACCISCLPGPRACTHTRAGCPSLPPPPPPLPLQGVLLPGARGWSELKAAAKKILQNLGEVQDTDRPLLTYTPQQLGALLQQQGIEVSAQAGPPWESAHFGLQACKPASRRAGLLATNAAPAAERTHP